MVRLARIAPLWIALILAVPAVPAAAKDHESVLVLNSFGSGDYFSEAVIRGILEALSVREGLVLYVDHLDVEHDPAGRQLERFRKLLADQDAESVDAIITIDEPALLFALQERELIGARTPVIFGDIKSMSPAELNALPNTTGVLGRYNIERTLEVMSALHPDRSSVVVVGDGSARSLRLRRDFDRARVRFANRFTFQDSDSETISELGNELATLGAGHLVFYLSFVEQAAGLRLSFFDSVSRVARAVDAPVYGAVEDMVGYGIVGGYLQSSQLLGQTLGAQVIEVLDGKDIAAIPIVEETPHRFVFDFRELARFGIPLRKLPAGSQVIEKPDTLFYRYREYLWFIFFVFVALVFYIVQLRISIQKRDKARRGLERLVEESANPLSIDQPTHLLAEIFDRLKTVAPFLEPRGLYRGRNSADAGSVMDFVPFGKFRGGAQAPNPALVKRAIETGRNQFDRNDVLLVLGNDKLPANLAYFRTARRLDAFDQRLVDLFTRNISIECDNIEAVRLSSSLESAHQLQDALLPKEFGKMAEAFDVDVHALVQPARQVGGDLYDLFPLDDDRLCLVIGDVADKGMPSALYMAMTRTLVRAAAETEADPGVILQKANTALCRENSQMMFVTLFCAIYTRGSGQLAYANAGHCPPFIRSADGEVTALPVQTNIALGVLHDATFPAQATTLPVGATLLMFTDGITEAMNASGEPFREARAKAVFSSNGAASAHEATTAIVSAVEAFAGQIPQSDDLTLLCLRRGP